jgi:oligo-1,6-glucosidase
VESRGKTRGFSASEPWISAGMTARYATFWSRRMYEESVLRFYRRLISMRREQPALVYGLSE